MLVNLKLVILKQRNKYGLSSAQVGMKCDLSESQLSLIVNEKRVATIGQKQKLIDFLKESEEYLFKKGI